MLKKSKDQTVLWKSVLERKQLQCLFSGDLISLDDLGIDHFLPWSFVRGGFVGEFNISLINEMPLFIDSFLLFNSDNEENANYLHQL